VSVLVGADGRARCAWAGSAPEYVGYHDDEWGTELHGDQPLFERMSLEGFQAGLSWITILRRRNAFRAAFADFDIERVAAFDAADVARLMADPGIIRNAAKIDATISNARVARELVREQPGALDRLLWGFAPAARAVAPAEIPATTAESIAASKSLKKLGFRFVGPTTIYALMQATGMVNDHAPGCFRAVAASAATPRP
jgi:DNA-3-methyladenine glycosylase I